jgi:adenine phosphoribosyltransferase
MDLKSLVRDIPDFPKAGIVFKDITPLLQNSQAYRQIVDNFVARYRERPIDVIVGVESRGFLFASVMAYLMNRDLAIVRKKGKLPYLTVSYTYSLEYGEDTIELHEDAIKKGAKVLIVDDLLATGGTAAAAAHLVEKMGGKVEELAFVIELGFLEGRKKLADYSVYSQIKYE